MPNKGVALKWKNRKRFDRKIELFQASMTDKRMKKAMHKAGLYVRKQIVKRTPIQEGNLRSALKLGAIVVTPHVVYLTIFASGLFGTRKYAKYIETGKQAKTNLTWNNLGVKSKAHNKSGLVGKYAIKRTFHNKDIMTEVLQIISNFILQD